MNYTINHWARQGRLNINNKYMYREFKLKFGALLKDYDHKYTENSKKYQGVRLDYKKTYIGQK